MKESKGSESLLEQVKADIRKNNRLLEDQASVITSDAGNNTRVILNIIQRIDFSKSKLPVNFLERRESNPFQEKGDFETNIRQMVYRIEYDRSDFDVNTSELDRYLYLIAQMLAGAVASGFVETAVSARICLANGFFRVRKNLVIPQNDESKNDYLQKCVNYMSTCYTYVSVKNMIDITNLNLEQSKKMLFAESEQLEKTKDKLADAIIQTPSLVSSIKENAGFTYEQSGSTWNKELVELFEMLVSTRVAESGLRFKKMRLGIEEKRIIFLKEAASKLNAYVTSVPVPEDPRLIDKMSRIMQETEYEAEKVDSDFDRLFTMVDHFTNSMKAISERSRHDVLSSDAYDYSDQNSYGQDEPLIFGNSDFD